MKLRFFIILIYSLQAHWASSATYSASDLMSGSISNTFQQWSACYLNPQSEDCRSCNQDDYVPRNLGPIVTDVQRSCIPSGQDARVAFSDLLTPDQMLQRDNYICQCLTSNRGSEVEHTAFENGVANTSTSATLRRASEAALSRHYQSELTSRLSTERIQSTFSAMSYVNNITDATNLANRYDQVNISAETNSSPRGSGNPDASASSEGAVVTAATVAYVQNANSELITPQIFNTDPMPAGFCLPYRHFIAHKQFPETPSFYRGLDNMTSYSAADWSYEGIMNALHEPFARGEEQALRNPQIRSRYERAKFLHGNPVLRNIFLSSNDAAKDRLFSIIKSMPRPDCSSGTCIRNQQWTNDMERYRRDMAAFLAHPDAIAANEVGAAISGRLNYAVAGEEARVRSQNSASVLGLDGAFSAASWKGFCAFRPEIMVSNSRLNSIRRIEEGFSGRNFNRPAADGEFQLQNAELCSEARIDPTNNNRTENFLTYFARECANASQPRCAIESRGALVGEFLSRTRPANPAAVDRVAQMMLPFLTGRVSGPQTISQSDAVNFNQTTNDPALASRPVRFTSQEYADLSPVAGSSISNTSSSSMASNLTRSPASTSTPAPASSTAVNPQSPDLNQGTFGAAQPDQNQIFVPSQPGSSAAQVTRSPEALRSSLEESETEAQGIRDEISSLRDVIRDPATAPRDPVELQGLTSRLENMERRLRQKENENNQLREDIADAEQVTRSGPQRGAPSGGAGNTGRSAPVSAQVASQGGSSSGASAGASASGSGGGAGSQLNQSSVGGRTASNLPRAVLSSGNSALLSKYGVQSGSVQGAIIVANPTEAIDYQSLRSQSEGSVIPLTITAEEYNLLASNDQSALTRYLDQVRLMPGNVVRLNITSAGQQMELFVLKNGNDISVIPSNTAGRSPASVAVRGREFTLSNLRNEISN